MKAIPIFPGTDSIGVRWKLLCTSHGTVISIRFALREIIEKDHCSFSASKIRYAIQPCAVPANHEGTLYKACFVTVCVGDNVSTLSPEKIVFFQKYQFGEVSHAWVT